MAHPVTGPPGSGGVTSPPGPYVPPAPAPPVVPPPPTNPDLQVIVTLSQLFPRIATVPESAPVIRSMVLIMIQAVRRRANPMREYLIPSLAFDVSAEFPPETRYRIPDTVMKNIPTMTAMFLPKVIMSYTPLTKWQRVHISVSFPAVAGSSADLPHGTSPAFDSVGNKNKADAISRVAKINIFVFVFYNLFHHLNKEKNYFFYK